MPLSVGIRLDPKPKRIDIYYHVDGEETLAMWIIKGGGAYAVIDKHRTITTGELNWCLNKASDTLGSILGWSILEFLTQAQGFLDQSSN
jgi:hypothetical protein